MGSPMIFFATLAQQVPCVAFAAQLPRLLLCITKKLPWAVGLKPRFALLGSPWCSGPCSEKSDWRIAGSRRFPWLHATVMFRLPQLDLLTLREMRLSFGRRAC